jgi:hypothetical protein
MNYEKKASYLKRLYALRDFIGDDIDLKKVYADLHINDLISQYERELYEHERSLLESTWESSDWVKCAVGETIFP